ncbi:aromatic ring-hydroxylating oxygenase subunit alpha [Scopulibacillus cellulosilyticus]|uniref:Aromatic ring-hydroxylating dioxygenase subunit alpha n=1 Tax=Scopulibacillus cellulosilyticus TaxID=2665665 RepID=A0ABW2PRV4_9BACL
MAIQYPEPNMIGAKTIPYRLYTDPTVLEAEKEKIFSKTWQYVCHESQIANPGDFFTCDIAGEPIILVRGNDGELRGFYNVCPHRGTQIEQEEAGCKKILQCPYHGWTFKLDGSLNKAPNFKNAPGFNPDEMGLRPVRVESEASLIFVNLDENAAGLANIYKDFFNDIEQFSFLPQLKKSYVKTRTIKCNWKAFIDNYLECDHCPIAHPGFAATLDLNKYHIINGNNCNIQGTAIKDKQQRGALELDLQNADVQEGRFYWLWPNIMAAIYPGPGNLSMIQMIPIDHETTLGIYTVYLIGDKPTKEQQILIDFAEQVRVEDVALVEAEQIGFRSKAFERGIISPTEHGVHYFHELVRRELNVE